MLPIGPFAETLCRPRSKGIFLVPCIQFKNVNGDLMSLLMAEDKFLSAARMPFLPLAISVRAVHRLLEHHHHGVAWPSTEHPITQLTSSILRRVNEASGLYQMFSVLADVVLVKE